MKRNDLNRRDFNRLTVAAFGGVVAGSAIGCASRDDAAAPSTPGPGETTDAGGDEEEGHVLLTGKNVCRGLNTCEGKGQGDGNACAGQGACAAAAAHSCHENNECRGQGGCGENPGQNDCRGQGECAVPLSEGAWTRARKAFEEAAAVADMEIGDAPAG